MREGQPLPRPRLQPRARAPPDEARGRRRARAASSGSRGTRRSTRSPTRLREIAAAHGPQAILPYSYAGNMGLLGYGSMDRRFFHALGASLLDRTICASAGGARLQGHRAARRWASTPRRSSHARLIVAWGANIVSSNVHLWPFVEEARRRGARLVTIDPYRSRTAEKSDQHLALYPGTDAALALGMMHVIFRDGLEDRDWLERYSRRGRRSCASARASGRRRATAAITGLPRGRDRGVRARVRDHAALGDPHQLRPQPPRRAAGWRCARSPACRPWSGPGATSGGGALLSTSGTFPVNTDGARAARPDPPRDAHPQHEPARAHPRPTRRSIRP